jgi:hypothetical protein
MFKKISILSVCLLILCAVRAEKLACEGDGVAESLTLAPKTKAKRVSQTTLRNELIDACEAYAHQLIAEVTHVSVLFERQVCRKKQSEAMQACLVSAADERCAALKTVLEFFDLPDDGTRVCMSCPGTSAEKRLVCAQARWTRALAQVQEVLLTQVRLLLEQDAQGHFYGATKDELRKAKGSIESFIKESIDCIANLRTESSECSSRDNRSKKQSL